MRIAALVIGILIMVLAGIGAIACLAMPSLTNNRVNLSEAMVGFVPAVIMLFVGFLLTIISAIFVVKARKNVVR